ncbi:hypothetical protein AUEXF2481DRAFT_361214 [Aureobasidium subglaciale EXF-2481]|uniref:Uncharacterized protein n=1 Tax=Aureobasidium subglaciale (strain EXF-2481) TaxID=1043005 RepID=A0A074Y530_AURSE|nr:uncharacterized protein AUEXF2481DRAFT_361214 [Aureobasidium subglaciale EXF-2481]KEQ92820.1 hypothetical protein AUEXF2481DRAFT_361214 [Aureobasidium subglaciale EXF-2481]
MLCFSCQSEERTGSSPQHWLLIFADPDYRQLHSIRLARYPRRVNRCEPRSCTVFHGSCPRLLSKVLSRRSNVRLIMTLSMSPLAVLSSHRHLLVNSVSRLDSVRVVTMTNILVRSDGAIAKLLGKTARIISFASRAGILNHINIHLC